MGYNCIEKDPGIYIKDDKKCKHESWEAHVYEFNIGGFGSDKKEALEDLKTELDKMEDYVKKVKEDLDKKLEKIKNCKTCGGESYLEKHYYNEYETCPDCGQEEKHESAV